MSSSTVIVDPAGWEYDLHSVYATYIAHFETQHNAWYAEQWGQEFLNFAQFLEYGWPVVIATDSWTYRPSIVTKLNHINTFLKMIKSRYRTNIPLVENIARIRPFELQPVEQRFITSLQEYKILHSTLPATLMTVQKSLVRSGEVRQIEKLWNRKSHSFLAIDFEWSEKHPGMCLEWGYAALNAQSIDSGEVWPPRPHLDYRKGHYVIKEYVDTVVNKRNPTFPRNYAFGESHYVSKAQLTLIIQSIIDCFASPDSSDLPNTLVIVGHGISGDLDRLAELSIHLPGNAFVVDTTSLERKLFLMGKGPPIADPTTSDPRQAGSTLSLTNLLKSLKIDVNQTCQMHNSGNDAFMALLAFQLLLEPTTNIDDIGLKPTPSVNKEIPQPLNNKESTEKAFPRYRGGRPRGAARVATRRGNSGRRLTGQEQGFQPS